MVSLNNSQSCVDIVVPVFNALNYAHRCLGSVCKRSAGVGFRVIIVNDGSDADTTASLREFVANNPMCKLLEHDKNLGYTRAVNTGLKHSTAPFVVLLNSDTEVTEGWLSGLLQCFSANSQIGIVGPLSNAASWQSVPRLLDDSGQFCINQLPEGISVNNMASIINDVSLCHYPQVPFVNGFCFMIRRPVIDTIGYMDEEAFPLGYGEENDYCLRAAQAGFKLVIADNVYVHHAKSKSFGHDKRKKLSRDGSENLKKRYGRQYFNEQAQKMRHIPSLDALRQRVNKRLKELNLDEKIEKECMKILFVLPKPGIGGGSHSVVQEVSAMRDMGLEAGIAVEQRHLKMLYERYQEIQGVKDLFVGYTDESLLDVAKHYDIAVATIFHSTNLVKYISDVFPYILPAYYVQDYEPLFFEKSESFYQDALDSYSRLKNGLLFAKTYWIAREVEKHHGVAVEKVVPSIDHAVYFPGYGSDVLDGRNEIHLAAMIRPRTPRRGAGRTMELLRNIKHRFGQRVVIHLFGCDESEPGFKALKRDFEYKHYGILQRTGVADLLRQADIFIDLSDYQAFGRTSLEAMACGATAMLPVHGGGDEYAVDGENALVVDSFDLHACEARLVEVIEDLPLLRRLKAAALSTSQDYSPQKAAESELELMQTALSLHRQKFPLPDQRPELYILRDRKAKSPHMLQDSHMSHALWNLSLVEQLPQVNIGGGVLITQGILSLTNQETLSGWHKEWLASGGVWLHEVAEARFLKEPLVQWALSEADGTVVFSTDSHKETEKLASNVLLVSSEFTYLNLMRTLLFLQRRCVCSKLAVAGSKVEMPKSISTSALRRKRLWRKFRTQPRQYFADSKIAGLRYLQYFFWK